MINSANISNNNFVNQHPVNALPLPPAETNSLIDTICAYVKDFFKIVIHSLFAISNPTLFFIGVVVGVIWSDGVTEAINKLVAVWDKHWILGTIIPPYFTAAYLACGAILCGANCGRMIYEESISEEPISNNAPDSNKAPILPKTASQRRTVSLGGVKVANIGLGQTL